MPEPRDMHRNTTGFLSYVVILLGVAIIVRTVTAGGGPLAFGLLMGVLFVAAGAGRLYVNARLMRRRD
jgi:hypothetical protein